MSADMQALPVGDATVAYVLSEDRGHMPRLIEPVHTSGGPSCSRTMPVNVIIANLEQMRLQRIC